MNACAVVSRRIYGAHLGEAANMRLDFSKVGSDS